MTARPICLITGATDGVGKATARALAAKGFLVALAARNEAKAERVRREIEAAGGRDVDILIGDLGALSDVRRLAATFQQRHPRLDVLINNAGVMATRRAITADGYESQFQVNYLSTFLLTQLLLEDLKRSEQGRIVNLGSSVYTLGRFDPANLQGERRFSAIGAYASSKLLLMMSTIELARRLGGTPVTANAVHPGVVNTPMLQGAAGLFKLIALLATPFALSPEKGAAGPLFLAASPEVAKISGGYFTGARPAAVKSKFNTAENRSLLWEISLEAAGLQRP